MPVKIKNKRRLPVASVPVSSRGIKQKFPRNISPMLATLVDKPFDAEGWVYEVKWDGYRALAYLDGGKVDIRSRNNKLFNEKFYPVYNALKELKLNAVLDGEIIVVNEQGISSFENLQGWRSEADGELKFYVFDVLWLNGYSLMQLPYTTRRKTLQRIIPDSTLVHLSQTFDSTGTEFFNVAKKMELEGIMAKKADSQYIPGTRSKEWLKIKVGKRHEVVVGGYTQNEGSSKAFSSLLVGMYENGILHYTGKVGTGFTSKVQKELMDKFRKLETNANPFDIEPDINKPSRFRPNPPKATVTWLKPRLVAEVSYAEITGDGTMRHPSFEGLREDKKATDVKPEKAKPAKAIVNGNSVLHKKKIIRSTGKTDRKTLLNPADETQERSINGHLIKFTNLSKIFWPKEKLTKRDMLNYYYQVAPYMLSYMKDRPQSLNRHPNGINGESFYQKDVTGKVPGWIATFPYHSDTDGRDKNFMVCTDEASLLYIASLGCIEMNPWSSTAKKPDYPDWCIIDLDPDNNKFDKVIETANVVHEILKSAGVDCYPKTSGSTGIHIYIPLGAKYTYEESKEFGRLIARVAQQQLSKFTSIERATKLRKGKLYIDFLQNRPQATLAAPYSVRPKPGATVSAPLLWEEVRKGMKMADFTMLNMPARIKETGDLFKPVLGKGINMKKARRALEEL